MMEFKRYTVEYRKKGKPTSNRKFSFDTVFPKEIWLYDDVINKICKTVYGEELLGFEIEELVEFTELGSDPEWNYLLAFKENNRRAKLLFEYEVEVNRIM